MKQHWDKKDESFFGIGILEPKTTHNIGTLWRSAYILGADFIFIIGGKYVHQTSDTAKTWSKIPFYKYKNFQQFYETMPYSTQLVGVELSSEATPIKSFKHPPRATYLLGSEDNGLPFEVITKCHKLVQLPGKTSLNVAVSGSILMFDRLQKIDDLSF
jgi:tRNA G18 (ribose-2'-O)-methylase SpoU